MGRHAAPPPPSRRGRAAERTGAAGPPRTSARNGALPGRGTSTATAGVLIGLAAVGLVVLTVLGVSLTGISLLPRGAAAAPPSPSPSASVDRVALTSSPAQSAIVATLDSPVAAGWTPAGAISWTGGTPFDSTCGRPETDSALAGARVFTVGRTQVVVTVSAYSAGAGAVALQEWATLLGSCRGGVTRLAVSAPGADALVAGIRPATGLPGASMLFWRRGDVVASVASPQTNPTGLAASAAAVDKVLLTAIAGRCADVASTMADAARSPWVAQDTFTGLTAPVTVSVTPSPQPLPPVGVTPVPATYSPSPLPSVSLPVRPAEPVWPVDLPLPVGSPIAPSRPTPAPVTSVVPSRLDDPVGPGCGWSFTGQVKPPYDAGTEALLAQARAQQAQADLVVLQQGWQAGLTAYWQDVPAYEQQALAFAAYASAVHDVAVAWDSITAARTAYANALAAYGAAVVARAQFFTDQALAQAAYNDAVAACAATPTDTPTPIPTPTGAPTPPDTATPTPPPTAVPACPPAVPPILSQPPPTLPPVPTPPPDPRPPPSPS